ncbi:hypothetical protein OG196_31645 [Kitasatospora purpeofusca]|uniref:hypothetical protein n=1 Tax=Kitasatospora purpeofusca TaxID=67352 RepID=UPI002E124F64|nr:hypothetical protein OG196_31645 [Kitasatospora purpeofusca]
MTDLHDSPDESIRPFCVPISAPLAQASAEVLRTFRALADKATIDLGEINTGSSFGREVEALTALPGAPEKEARRGLHALAVDAGQLTWAHAVDHVRALEHDVLMDPPPVWSPLALARVVLEGFTFTHHLYDPSISLAQRLARAASLDGQAGRNVKAASIAFGPEEQAGALRRLADAEAMVLTAGAVPRRAGQKRKVIGYEIDGEYAPLNHGITDQSRLLLPDWAAGSYPLLSGAAHGRPWMIARARSASGWNGEAATVLAAVTTVLGALESAVATFGGYFNTDIGAVQAELADVRMAFLHRSFALTYASSP